MLLQQAALEWTPGAGATYEYIEAVKAELMQTQYVAVEEAARVPVWTGDAASEGQDVVYARGIEMIKKSKAPTGFKGGGVPSMQAEQRNLWLESDTRRSHERTLTSSTPQPEIATLRRPQSRQSAETKNSQRTLQDLLFAEGLLAARLSVPLDSIEVLQSQLVHHLPQDIPTHTALLIVLHHLFAPNGPRTVELCRLFANPFWKYLGFKSEDMVRAVLRSADAAGVLGKYVVAAQLE